MIEENEYVIRNQKMFDEKVRNYTDSGSNLICLVYEPYEPVTVTQHRASLKTLSLGWVTARLSFNPTPDQENNVNNFLEECRKLGIPTFLEWVESYATSEAN